MQDDLVGEKRGGMAQVVSSGSGRLGGPVQPLKPAGQPTLLSPQVRTSCFFYNSKFVCLRRWYASGGHTHRSSID
jgi:hypothetical protein